MVMLVTYYFHFVRCLFLDHFEQQRRLLNLNAQRDQDARNVNDNVFANLVQDGRGPNNAGAAGHEENREDEGEWNLPVPVLYVLDILRMIFVLVFYFFVALNHDWIDPLLRALDQERAEDLADEAA